ncbi:MAG TPA: hypothetical protein VFG20_18415, partial [Planctomycetaceae bacterium]|nr:hypothetical protein [Planctomycetaceae bacterium]
MFWEHDQLSPAAKTALLKALSILGGTQVEPEHAVWAILSEEPCKIACVPPLLSPADFSVLARALAAELRSSTRSAPITEWSERLLSPRFLKAVQEAQNAAEWSQASDEQRNRLIGIAIFAALKPSVNAVLQSCGVAVEQLISAFRVTTAESVPHGPRRPRSFPSITPAPQAAVSPPEGFTPRNVGPIRSAPGAASGGAKIPESKAGKSRGRVLPGNPASAPSPQPPLSSGDEVQCTAFAPPVVQRGETFLVQVFAHLPDRLSEADRLAREFDAAAGECGFAELSETVQQGQLLRFDLKLTGGTADLESASLRWRGRTASVQFVVTAGTVETMT